MSLYNSSRHQDHILSRHAQSPPSFTINLYPEHWLINNSRPNLYHTPISFLLDEVRERRIPPDWLQAFDQHGVTFYDGCLIVELVDHRVNDKPPTRERVLLPLDPESLWNDIRIMQEKGGKSMSDSEALELEARILAATSPPLCLDPDPVVSRIVNTALRMSVLPAPAALRKKDLTVDNDRDTAIKARSAKIMSLFNPHKSRISQPSTRLLEIIQSKQSNVGGQAQNQSQAAPPTAPPIAVPNGLTGPQGLAVKKKPTLTLKPPKMEDGTALSAVNSAADEASNPGSAHQVKRKASTSEQPSQPAPKKKMSKKNDGSMEQSPSLPQASLTPALPQQVNQPSQSVAYPLAPNPAAAVQYPKPNLKKVNVIAHASTTNPQNRQQKMETNAEASRQTPVDPTLKNPAAVLQENMVRANTLQAQAAYAAAVQAGQSKPSTPQPPQSQPVQQNMPPQHNPFMHQNQAYNMQAYQAARIQAVQAAQVQAAQAQVQSQGVQPDGQTQPTGAQQYQANQGKFPQAAQFTFPPQFNMQNMAQYRQLDAARAFGVNAAARAGTPNANMLAQAQAQSQFQAQSQLQPQQPSQPPGAMPQMAPSRSPFQPQQAQSSPQLSAQSPNLATTQAHQNALRAALAYSQANPGQNNSQLHPYLNNPALVQQLQLRNQALQQQQQMQHYQQQLQAQAQAQQASQQQQQPQAQQFGMQIAPNANFQQQLPAGAQAAAGFRLDPARAQILAQRAAQQQATMAQQVSAAGMGRGIPGVGRGQPRQ